MILSSELFMIRLKEFRLKISVPVSKLTTLKHKNYCVTVEASCQCWTASYQMGNCINKTVKEKDIYLQSI